MRRPSVYAIEVARRQPDGTWRWLIGDPFTLADRRLPEAAAELWVRLERWRRPAFLGA